MTYPAGVATGRAPFIRRVLARYGPRVHCRRCGQTLFRGVAFVSRGQVKVLGADDALVQVDFDTTTRLGFRHVELSSCTRKLGVHGSPDDPR